MLGSAQPQRDGDLSTEACGVGFHHAVVSPLPYFVALSLRSPRKQGQRMAAKKASGGGKSGGKSTGSGGAAGRGRGKAGGMAMDSDGWNRVKRCASVCVCACVCLFFFRSSVESDDVCEWC